MPTGGQRSQPLRKYHLEHAIWGYAAETGLHAVRLIVSGVFDRFPNLEIVIGHMGENIPYSLYRMDWMHEMTARTRMMERPKLRQRPSDYFRQNFFITTSGVNWDPALEFCISVLGADRIMWAVDYPYQETMEAVRFLNEAPISEAAREKIFHRNAERVFRIQS
jgi:predicted TIM-barrel fold metal-dependent hydrolase